MHNKQEYYQENSCADKNIEVYKLLNEDELKKKLKNKKKKLEENFNEEKFLSD